MLVTLSYALPGDAVDHDATALGFLLYKHPAKLQSFDIAVGTAHVFYPESTPERTTAALLLELDPVELARSKRFTGDTFALAHYVNDLRAVGGAGALTAPTALRAVACQVGWVCRRRAHPG